MKIALFSDVHANLPALQAVLATIDKQNPDMIFCLGDLVGYAPHPNEVIETLRQRKIPTIAGNHDEFIGFSPHDQDLYQIKEGQSESTISKHFTNQTISCEARNYLKHLPRHFKADFKFGEETFSILLVHGSPRRINEYLLEDHDESDMLAMMKKEQVRIMAFGHTHKPFHRIMKDHEGNWYHAINLGAVGKPKDGDNRACYVMVEITEQTTMKVPDSLVVDFIRVPYDIERVAAQIEAGPLPNIYAERLRLAY